MVQLVVYNQSNGDSSYLDLGDVSIKADYSSIEIQDITKRKSESTQAFTLPFTDTNNSFFSHFYNVNASGDFDSNSKVKASILVDSIEVLDGYLQLLKVDANTENYDVVVLGEVANIVKSLGADQLNDLDFSSLSHEWSRVNINRSWEGNTIYTNGTGGDEILYPIIDYGYGLNDEAVLGQSSNYISYERLKPAIKLKTLFYKVLESIGYTINSTFFNTDFFTKQYMTLANDTQQLASQEPDYFKGEIDQDSNGIRFTNNKLYIPFPVEQADLYGNWSGGSLSPQLAGKYTVPISGKYRFKLGLNIDFYRPTGSGSITYTLQAVVGSTVVAQKHIAVNDTKDFSFVTASISLESGDEVKFTIKDRYNIADYSDLKGYATLLEAPAIQLGTTVDLSSGNNVLPSIKQSDFISSILSRYNLIVETDKEVANQLNIEPAQDYFNAGTSKDWTDKLDASKNIVIKPTSEYQKKELLLSDLEADDKQNKEHQEQLGAPYNSFSLKFSNDFAEDGKIETKSVFCSYTNDYFGGLLIGQNYIYDGETPTFVKTPPKLFAYSGLKDANYKVKEHQLDTATISMDEYPMCSTYIVAGNEIKSTDEDIRFRSIPKFGESFIVNETTQNDTYNTCWESYLNNLYGTNARILIANFNLNSVDIANFKYNDRVFVKDAYYRVNKIKGFSLGKDVSTQVELIKILRDDKVSPWTGCTLTMTGVNSYGFAIWSTQNPSSYIMRKCCEGLGYSFGFYSNTPVCYVGSDRSLKSIQHTTTTTDGTTTIGRSGSRVSIEGTISKLGESASDGQILSWSNAVDSTRWITFPDEIPLDDGKILIGNSTNVASKSTLQGDANISVTKDDAGGTTTIGLDSVPAAGTNGQIQVNDNGDLGTGTGLSYVGTTLITPNVTATGDVDVTGDVTAANFIGNGSGLTNLPTTNPSTPLNSVQFNYNGAFTGDSDFSFNQFSNILDVSTIRAENATAGIYLSGGFQYMFLTPVDFRATASSSSSGFISNDGARLGIISGQSYYAQFQVPKGYKVNYVDLKGSANYTFLVYASSYSSGNQVYKASGTINTPLTLLSYQQLIGAAGDYFTIKVNPSGYGNYIYGCQLGLIKT